MPAIWSALTTKKPMSAERVAKLIRDAKAWQVSLQKDALLDLIHCQEKHVEMGAEIGRLCLEMTEPMNKDRMQKIRDLDRQIAEWRAYVAR